MEEKVSNGRSYGKYMVLTSGLLIFVVALLISISDRVISNKSFVFNFLRDRKED